MFYRQNRFGIKLLETVGFLFVLIGADLYWDQNLSQSVFQPFVILMLLIAIRYGLLFGLIAFSLYFGYTLFNYLAPGGDVLLLFYDVPFLLEWLFNLLVVLIAGLYSSSQRERYESLHYNLEEVKTDNVYLHDTVLLMETTQKTLRRKVLESDYSVQRLYSIALTLDKEYPELIRSETLSLMAELYQTNEVAVYHLDSSKKSLRLLSKRGKKNQFPQTILVDDTQKTLQRMLATKKMAFRQMEDPDDSPLLVAPIVMDGQISEVIVFHQFAIEKLTTYDIQVFETIVDWIGSRYKKAKKWMMKDEEEKMYQGSSVYKPIYFREKMLAEKSKLETDHIPYSVLEFDLKKTTGLTPYILEQMVLPYLREIDKLGFDEERQELFILLPGTEEEQGSEIVQERITTLLANKGVLVNAN